MFEAVQQNPEMMKKAYEQMSGMMGGAETPQQKIVKDFQMKKSECDSEFRKGNQKEAKEKYLNVLEQIN